MFYSGIHTLEIEEVIGIHTLLVEDFINGKDPIEPPGIRENGDLLESAVNRQYVGFEGKLKYPDPIQNASTLCYGVCCNHGFHNGNKRVALVCLLCHLDNNNITLKNNIDQKELYTLMLKIASHKFSPKRNISDTSDIEISEITKWLRKRTRKYNKGEKVVTFRELGKILREHNIFFENQKNNYVDVIKYEFKRKHIWSKKTKIGTKVANIPYPMEGREVGRKLLKSIRIKCELTDNDGFDSEMFYGEGTSYCKFILKYKKTLKRLAKI